MRNVNVRKLSLLLYKGFRAYRFDWFLNERPPPLDSFGSCSFVTKKKWSKRTVDVRLWSLRWSSTSSLCRFSIYNMFTRKKTGRWYTHNTRRSIDDFRFQVRHTKRIAIKSRFLHIFVSSSCSDDDVYYCSFSWHKIINFFFKSLWLQDQHKISKC